MKKSLILRYIEFRIRKLEISISRDSDSAFEFIKKGKLEGLCWQSTTFLAVYFKKTDFIVRGNLKNVGNHFNYEHSWIEFKFLEKEYVFDPCFAKISEKQEYYEEYLVEEKVRIPVIQVKKDFQKILKESQERDNYIEGTNNIEDTFFRTNSRFEKYIWNRISVRFYFQG